MEITEAQYRRIAPSLPRQRGNVRVTNLQFLNALLYVAEQGCKWRGLPRRFGPWHTIYTRMNRWSKSGVLDSVFEQLQREQLVRIRIEAVSLDSTTVKVHPTLARRLRSAQRFFIISDSRLLPSGESLRRRGLPGARRGRPCRLGFPLTCSSAVMASSSRARSLLNCSRIMLRFKVGSFEFSRVARQLNTNGRV